MSIPATRPVTALVIEDAAYERDFVAWLADQITFLRERHYEALDIPNLIEELTAMSARERRELSSRLQTIMLHLLKCSYQAKRKSRSWQATLLEQRHQVEELVAASPSLKPPLVALADASYAKAVRIAAIETGLARDTFPAKNPYTVDQLLDLDFVP